MRSGGKSIQELLPPLREAIALLERHGYRYAVIGGIAVAFWGTTRATRDVDLKVLVPDTDYPALRAILRAVLPERARPHIPPNPLIVDTRIGGIAVDFLLAAPGYEENIITNATSVDLEDWRVWICSPEDLIIQKAVAGRPQDWLDIEGVLIEQHARLDRDYIDDWLQQFAEALERPEMLAQYHKIQAHVQTVLAEHSDSA